MHSQMLLVMTALLAAAAAETLYRTDPPYRHRSPPPYRHPYGQPPPPPQHHHDDYSHLPTAYAFGYAVADYYHGTNFGHQEERDGYATKGSYKVNLPDGRVQIVSYVADDINGYQAHVQYQGQPEPAYPAYHKPLYA